MKSPTKRELTLDRLRMSVQTMILQSDWNEIGVQDIAKLANVSIGTFYNYFESKDAALEDLKSVLSEVLYRDLDMLVQNESDPVLQLTLLVKYFFGLAESGDVWSRYTFGGNHFSDRLKPGLKSKLLPILYAGRANGAFKIQDVEVCLSFLDQGLFGLLWQTAHKDGTGAGNAVSTAELCLRLVGVDASIAAKAAQIVCPRTPLCSLPVSPLKLNQIRVDYA